LESSFVIVLLVVSPKFGTRFAKPVVRLVVCGATRDRVRPQYKPISLLQQRNPAQIQNQQSADDNGRGSQTVHMTKKKLARPDPIDHCLCIHL
jgi:hypothetical protein